MCRTIKYQWSSFGCIDGYCKERNPVILQKRCADWATPRCIWTEETIAPPLRCPFHARVDISNAIGEFDKAMQHHKSFDPHLRVLRHKVDQIVSEVRDALRSWSERLGRLVLLEYNRLLDMYTESSGQPVLGQRQWDGLMRDLEAEVTRALRLYKDDAKLTEAPLREQPFETRQFFGLGAP